MSMYSRIITPLDSSDVADQVLPYVRLLAKGLEIPVELFRAIEPVSPDLTDPRHGLYLDQVVTSMRVWGQEYLNKIASPMRAEGISVTCEVHEGNAAPQILEEAQRNPEALIAMSTHGRSGVARWVLGSVANKVLHATSNPLLLVRSQENRSVNQAAEISRLIVPLDGSPEAEQVFPHVVALANGLDMKVVLTRVMPTAEMFLRYGGYAVIQHGDLMQSLEEEAVDYINLAKQELSRQGLSSTEEHLVHGNPANSIVELTQDVEGSMVAMTSHGRSGVSRWVLGSVADRVVRHSGSPVLLVRSSQQ